jgi:hypothetical protein
MWPGTASKGFSISVFKMFFVTGRKGSKIFATLGWHSTTQASKEVTMQ